MSLKKENNFNPFSKIEHKEKFDKLIGFIKSFQDSEIKEMSNEFYKTIKKNNDSKTLLMVLSAIYLETDFIKWESARRRVLDFSLFYNKSKFNLFKKLFQFKKSGKVQNINNEEYVDMYINIGKDKKVFPGHLINFICLNLKIKQTQILNIRVFESYSFFKIPKNMAEKAVLLLSIKKFRGKSIIVNYSKIQN